MRCAGIMSQPFGTPSAFSSNGKTFDPLLFFQLPLEEGRVNAEFLKTCEKGLQKLL
jgi:hypothetical protein